MKKLRLLCLTALLLTGALSPARAQTFEWANLTRGADFNGIYSPRGTSDPAGNLYWAAPLTDSATVAGVTYYPASTSVLSTLIVKIDAQGRAEWAQQVDGVAVEQLAFDRTGAGGVFVLGEAKGAAPTWGGTALSGVTDRFYGKCAAATGALQWVNPLPFDYVFPSMVADNLGNAYLGATGGTGPLGGVTLDSTGAYVVQINSTGAVQWVRKLRTPNSQGFCSWSGVCNFRLGAKPTGGCLAMGGFHGTLEFGSATSLTPALTSVGFARDGFLLNIDAGGSLLWSQLVAGNDPSLSGATGDAANNVYLTGGSYRPLTIGTQTQQEGFFVAKFNAAGALQWLRGQEPDGDVNAKASQPVVDHLGQVSVVLSTYPLPFPTVLSGTLGLRLTTPDMVARYNSQGAAQWVTSPSWEGYVSPPGGGGGNLLAPFWMVRHLSVDVDGNLFGVGDLFGHPDFTRPMMTFDAATTVGLGVVAARISGNSNLLTGYVYFDGNGNGHADRGEGQFYPQRVVQLTTNGYVKRTTPYDSLGAYEITADTGAYELAIPAVPLHYTMTQPTSGTYRGTFGSTRGQTVAARDFGLAPLPNEQDVRVTLTPVGLLRAGRPLKYLAAVDNVGTTTISQGTMTITLPAQSQYIGASAGGTHSGSTVSWPYANLAPMGHQEFYVWISLPITLTIGTLVPSGAQAGPLAGDLVPADNLETREDPVVAGFDPNDITVNYEALTPGQVAAGQPLDYTIRFENVGTDTAFAIILQDTLPASLLQTSTLDLISQSHNCTWMVSGAGLLTVRFPHINLPYRDVDILRCQGFVRFRVTPRTTLAVGDLIPNKAHITFDYNAPVATNQATTVVAIPNGLVADPANAAGWSLYPNPAATADRVQLTATVPTAGSVTVQVLDALGREVRATRLTAPAGPLRHTLDVRGLAPGLYGVRLTTSGATTTQQLVVSGR